MIRIPLSPNWRREAEISKEETDRAEQGKFLARRKERIKAKDGSSKIMEKKMSKFTPHESHEMNSYNMPDEINTTTFFGECRKCKAKVWGSTFSFDYDSALARKCRKQSAEFIAKRNREMSANE